MSQVYLDLRDRLVTDAGEVVAKYELLRSRAFTSLPLNTMPALVGDHVLEYNRGTPTKKKITVWEPGEPAGPPAETYQWNIPQEYQDLDISEVCIDALIALDLHEQQVYLDRLEQELLLMQERYMFGFVKALIYVRDQFRKYDVVWGVGRGSSCASLIMYLLQINRVDPVLYEIPLEEFFKPEVQDA